MLTATAIEAALLQSSRVSVVLTGIGAVNTAYALTQYLATQPRPSLVIQTGIAGAYVPAGIPVGAVVLADTEIYGDLGVTDRRRLAAGRGDRDSDCRSPRRAPGAVQLFSVGSGPGGARVRGLRFAHRANRAAS